VGRSEWSAKHGVTSRGCECRSPRATPSDRPGAMMMAMALAMAIAMARGDGEGRGRGRGRGARARAMTVAMSRAMSRGVLRI